MVATSIGIAISTAMGAVMSALTSVGTAVAGSIGLTVGTAAAATGSLATITTGTAAAIGAVSLAGAASGILGGISSYQTGKAQEAVYNYNASVAEMNADLARQEGEDRAAEQRRQTKRLIAQQNNSFGALGILSGTGTALDLTSESAYFGELNAITEKYNYDLQAWNYENEAISLRYKADAAASAGKMGLITGVVKSTATLLTAGLGAASGLGSKITSGLASAFDKPIKMSGGIIGDAITFA